MCAKYYEHANSILETFVYFCQISSKSITIILTYTVSKLVHFLRHSAYLYIDKLSHRVKTFPFPFKVYGNKFSHLYTYHSVTQKIRQTNAYLAVV